MAIINMSQAAKAAKVGRTTLYRHAKKGTLSITTLPDGSPGVDTAELFRVFPQGSGNVTVTGTHNGTLDETGDTSLLNLRISHLEELLAVERRNNEDLRQSLRLIEHKRSVGWLSKLFGQKG